MAGLLATLVLAVAAAPALGGDLFIMSVAKKGGDYESSIKLNVPPNGKTKIANFKLRNNSASPFDANFTQDVFGGSGGGITLRWFRGTTEITSDVKGGGYVEEIDAASEIIIKMKAKATRPATKCVDGRGETKTANVVATVAINDFCTMR